tara:strand:- start:733 stop:1329 length:597 start_codon:yes stop_codon:yes gene_type:complete
MSAQLHLLFPTPVYVDNIGVDFEISTVRQYVDADGGLISMDQDCLLENRKLKEEVDRHTEYYLRDHLRLNKSVGLKHQCSWILLTQKGGYTGKHFHSNSWLSGIYYFHVTETSGDLEFEHSPPNWCAGNMDPSKQIEEYNMINSTSIMFRPRPGDLYLFPSDLHHAATRNESSEQRICLPFNYSLCGQWGSLTKSMTA